MLTKKQIENQGFKVKFTNGTGNGGQKRNRTYSVAIVEHLGTGEIEKCDETRVSTKNMNIAHGKLLLRVISRNKEDHNNELNKLRQESVDNGIIRTYNFKRGIVKDHRTKKQYNIDKFMNGIR